MKKVIEIIRPIFRVLKLFKKKRMEKIDNTQIDIEESDVASSINSFSETENEQPKLDTPIEDSAVSSLIPSNELVQEPSMVSDTAVASEIQQVIASEKGLVSESDITSDDSFNEQFYKKKNNRVEVFTCYSDVIGISYKGDNHVKAKVPVPCQDYHSFTKINDIWNLAIVSDGAGSKEHSDVGSRAVCAFFSFFISQLLKTDERFINGDIPNEKIWDLEFRSLLTKFQIDLKSKEQFKSYGFESLAATIIIFAYSPKGYLFAHVGDGRAGVKVNGEWITILTPHKGEEANQTIFSTTIEFIKKPSLMMSGVFVPETSVGNSQLEAFVLMSDGCEDGAWITYQKVNLPDGDYRVEDVNQPRVQTLDALMDILSIKEEKENKLVELITTFNNGFKTEGDDKTILIGKVK